MWSVAPIWVAWGTMLVSVSAPARERVWLRAQAGQVEVLTTAGAPAAQAALIELEKLRAAMAQTAPSLAGASARLTIVGFSGEEEFAGFRLNTHSPAYFAGGAAGPVIVIGRLEPEAMPALRHEFVHFLLRASGCRLPLWLEEGLADALSPLPAEEAERRVRLLRRQRLPWQEVFTARPGAALYQDWSQARLFYAQSWALAEALIHSAGGRLENGDLEEWAALGDAQEQVLEALLRRFLKRPRLAGRKWKMESRPVDAQAAPAPAGLVWTVLGRLSLQLGRLEDAEERLRKAALVWPEALPLLGDLEYRRRRLGQARDAWRQAMARDVADARTLLRLAVLEQDLPGGEMTPVLEKLLAMDPAQEEARLALASQYIRRGRWEEARRCLAEVRSAPPRWAGFYQQAVALVRARTVPAETLGTN